MAWTSSQTSSSSISTHARVQPEKFTALPHSVVRAGRNETHSSSSCCCPPNPRGSERRLPSKFRSASTSPTASGEQASGGTSSTTTSTTMSSTASPPSPTSAVGSPTSSSPSMLSDDASTGSGVSGSGSRSLASAPASTPAPTKLPSRSRPRLQDEATAPSARSTTPRYDPMRIDFMVLSLDGDWRGRKSVRGGAAASRQRRPPSWDLRPQSEPPAPPPGAHPGGSTDAPGELAAFAVGTLRRLRRGMCRAVRRRSKLEEIPAGSQGTAAADCGEDQARSHARKGPPRRSWCCQSGPCAAIQAVEFVATSPGKCSSHPQIARGERRVGAGAGTH